MLEFIYLIKRKTIIKFAAHMNRFKNHEYRENKKIYIHKRVFIHLTYLVVTTNFHT